MIPLYTQQSGSGGEFIPNPSSERFSNANDPNATFDSSHLSATGSTVAEEGDTAIHKKGHQLPLNLVFSTVDIKGKDLEELLDARRDWIQREQYEDAKGDETKSSCKFRPLLQVAMADSRFNSKSTRLFRACRTPRKMPWSRRQVDCRGLWCLWAGIAVTLTLSTIVVPFQWHR